MIGKLYLAELNPAQRRAVEHGVTTTGANIAESLLVIAGAGSGKTNTLAHLLIHGTDPGRILLLTFSRRAAAEMERRAGSSLRPLEGRHRSPAAVRSAGRAHFTPSAPRLLRAYAGWIGLDPGFTIHDREDSGGLINLVRHELVLSGKEKRFPLKGTCLHVLVLPAVPEGGRALEAPDRSKSPQERRKCRSRHIRHRP